MTSVLLEQTTVTAVTLMLDCYKINHANAYKQYKFLKNVYFLIVNIEYR